MHNNPYKLLRILNIASIVFGVVLALAAGMLLYNHLESRRDQAAFQELASLVEQQTLPAQAPVQSPTGPAETTAPTQPQPEVSPYWVLYDQNQDFAAWLTVPGTRIDYPVMYTPEDIEHYIYRSFDGKTSHSGTPFVGANGSLENTKCIIYGHNMGDGTMFHDLLSYQDPAFFRENPTFTIATLKEARTYEIFAALPTRILTPSETGQRFYHLEEGVTQWLADRAAYDTGVAVDAEDEIVILVTCSYHTEQGRFLVAGRLAEAIPYADPQ